MRFFFQHRPRDDPQWSPMPAMQCDGSSMRVLEALVQRYRVSGGSRPAGSKCELMQGQTHRIRIRSETVLSPRLHESKVQRSVCSCGR